MITVRPGSHMYSLLRLLSIVGEFPSKSMGIFGDVRTVKAMIHKMESAQKIRLSNGDIIGTKLFQLSGKWNDRTIRLNKNALAVFNDIHPDALNYYLDTFPDNRFSGNQLNIHRNHRVGEAIAMCMMAGIETAPYVLPELQKAGIRSVIPETPSYYVSRNFKKICEAELNKTMFTRVVGLLFYPGGSYAVYNTRGSVMKWSGLGEIKAKLELSEIVRMNAGPYDVNSALLFGAAGNIALQTLIESSASRKIRFRSKGDRFDEIYRAIHFVPLDQNGIALLKILTLPDWHEKLINALFSKKMRPKGYYSFEADAHWENKFYYSHFDGDIARLIRFKETAQSKTQSFEVLCFPWQAKFLNDYLGDCVILKTLEMQKVLNALHII